MGELERPEEVAAAPGNVGQTVVPLATILKILEDRSAAVAQTVAELQTDPPTILSPPQAMTAYAGEMGKAAGRRLELEVLARLLANAAVDVVTCPADETK